MTIHRTGSIVLLACVSAAASVSTVHSQSSGGAFVTVPLPESIVQDRSFAPPVGWTEYGHTAVGDRLVALRSATQGNDARYFVEYVRSPSGEWLAPRPIAVEGMPEPAFALSFLTDGAQAFVYQSINGNSYGDYRVLRRSGGGWELLPAFPQALGSPRPLPADGRVLLTQSATHARTYELVGGAWTETRAIEAASVDLESIDFVGSVAEGVLFLQGSVDPAKWGLPAGCVRCVTLDLRRADAEPVHVPADPSVQQCVRTASGGGLVAVRDAAIGVAQQTQRVLELGAKGAFTERLRWRTNGTEGAPSRIGPGGVIVGNRWIRQRNAAGGWNPALWFGGNTYHSLRPFGPDGDVLSWAQGTNGSFLAVFDAPWDLDGNGVRDGDEIAAGAAVDCNRNGVPDVADIAAGRLADLDADGVPDACAEDCDANGVADLAEIRDGAVAACSGGGGLARCAIAEGAADSDGDGVPDDCSPDRDRNGIPDDVEIAAGAPDCDGNGIPNGAPVAGAVAEGIARPSDFLRWTFSTNANVTYLCGAYFPLSEPIRIDSVRFHVFVGIDPTMPASPVGRPFHVFVNQALTPAARLSESEVVFTGTGAYRNSSVQSIATPPVVLHPPGFFVSYTVPGGAFASGTYVPYDQMPVLFALQTDPNPSGDPRAGRGWVAGASSAAPVAQLLDVAVPFGWLPDIEVVANGCPLDGDFDGDGAVTGRDLGMLLGAWGPANGSPCDLDGDGSVDGRDLGILLANFSVRGG